MDKVRHWLSELKWSWIIVLALFAGLAPWPMGPEPHVVEKVGWLMKGWLTKPLDIFDLFFHLSPTLLVVAKFAAVRTQSSEGPQKPASPLDDEA